MHPAVCPSCGLHVELDFQALAGLVWCPMCEKLFSPPVASSCESRKSVQNDVSEQRDGRACC